MQAVPHVARSASVDFLSGLVTIEGTMIALVDLDNLLAEPSGENDPNPAKGAGVAAHGNSPINH